MLMIHVHTMPLGSAYGMKGDTERAVAEYTNAIRINPEFALTYYNRGLVHNRARRTDDALSDYNASLQRDPKYLWMLTTIAGCWLSRGGNWHVQKRILPKRSNAIRMLEWHIIIVASCVSGQLRHTEAIRDFTEAIRTNPRHQASYYMRGGCWAEKGNFEVARKNFDEALRISPDDVNAHVERAQVLKNLGDLDAALRDYTEAIRLDGKHLKAYCGRAVCCCNKARSMPRSRT